MVSVMENGTGTSAKRLGVKGHFAGKTGTTNAGRDAWFVGFDRDIITVVWVGFDDSRALGLTGGKAAIPTWSYYNQWLNLGTYPFLPQSDVSKYEICADNQCSQTKEEWFVDGQGPSRRMRLLEQLWGTPNNNIWEQQCNIGDFKWEIDAITSGNKEQEDSLLIEDTPSNRSKENGNRLGNRKKRNSVSVEKSNPNEKERRRRRKKENSEELLIICFFIRVFPIPLLIIVCVVPYALSSFLLDSAWVLCNASESYAKLLDEAMP